MSLADYSNGYYHCNDFEVLEAKFQNILVFLFEKQPEFSETYRHFTYPWYQLFYAPFTFLSPYSTLPKPKSLYLKLYSSAVVMSPVPGDVLGDYMYLLDIEQLLHLS